ncbi:MAG: hypothetical protein K1X92_15025 [Bacteroidia bacterium]|nr:hypothetical protein [Bacteroidia bacterium]
MKSKYFLPFLFLLLSFSALTAQTAKGTMFAGKPVYFESLRQISPGYVTGQFTSVSIFGGRFISKDLAVGAGVKSTQSIVSMIKNPTQSAGSMYGFVRQYVPVKVRNVKAYGQAEVAYNLAYIPGLNMGTGENQTTLQQSLSLGVSPGISYFAGKHFSADAFVSGVKVDLTQLKNRNYLNVLSQLGNAGVGVSGTVYF